MSYRLTTMMARLTWGLLSVTLVAAGCGAGGSKPGGQIWERTFLSSAVTQHGQIRPLVAGTRIRLTFDNRTRELKADAGCNHLTGRVSLDGSRLAVSDLGGSAMSCDAARQEQDTWLARFI